MTTGNGTLPKYADIFAKYLGEVDLEATGQTHRVRPISPELVTVLEAGATPRENETPNAASQRHLAEIAGQVLDPPVAADAFSKDDTAKVYWILQRSQANIAETQRLVGIAEGNGRTPAATAQPTVSA